MISPSGMCFRQSSSLINESHRCGSIRLGSVRGRARIICESFYFRIYLPFGKLDGELTWPHGGDRTSYTATINTTLPLQCHDTTPCYSLVPGSECRPIPYYSSEACSAPTPLSLTAPTSTAAPLPRDPVLVANNSCTIRSSLAPSFAITDWWATTQYGRSWPRNFPDLFENGYYSRVGFSLWNSGLGRTIPVAIKGHEITPYSSPWAGNVTGKWYPCRQYETWEKPDAPVPGTTGCEFMVDLETGYVAFRVGWVCDELDGEHP